MAQLGTITMTFTPVLFVVHGLVTPELLAELSSKVEVLCVQLGRPVKIEMTPTLGCTGATETEDH